MQFQQSTRPLGQRSSVALARPKEEPLSDGAIVTLLGGLYVGGLATFLAAAYGVSLLL